MSLELKAYVQQTESVADAGRELQRFLAADANTRAYSAEQLSEVAKRQTEKAAGFRAFMFAEGARPRAADKAAGDPATEELLASLLSEVQVANVLLAAGRAVGETDEPPQPELLDQALNQLEDTTQQFKQVLTGARAPGAEAQRFAFAGAVAKAPAPVQSPDLPAAIDTFRTQSEQTLAALVKEARGVVASVVETLKDNKLSGKVLEALSQLGSQVLNAPQLGRLGNLVRQGLEKLSQAVDALIKWVGSDALAHIKGELGDLWAKVSGGEDLLTQLLTRVFGLEDTRTKITDVLALDGLAHAALDQSSTDLQQLAARFKQQMSIAGGVATAVAFTGTVLLLTPFAGVHLALLAASANVLIMAVVVLLGMDYADSGRILQRVRGVGEIAGSLRPAAH
jgi:phage shock protein A